MYFKATAGKKAVKLMIGETLLKFKRAAAIVIMNEDEKRPNTTIF